MGRVGRRAHAIAAMAAGLVLVGGGLVPSAAAQGPDKSDVVIVLDFSASILDDKPTRDRFGAALDRIAARVDEISADLLAGDTTVSLVQFAAAAADVPGCTDLKLLNSPAGVEPVRQLPARGRSRLSQGPQPGPHEEDRRRHELRRGDGAGREASPGGLRPAGADPLHRRQARRRRRPGQPGPARPATRSSGAARRSPCCRSAWASIRGNASALAAGLERPEDHPRHARVRQRRDLRLAEGRVRVGRRGRERRRRRAPGRHLHVHRGPDAHADPGPVAGPGPGDPAQGRAMASSRSRGRRPPTSPVPIIDFRARCRAGQGEWIESTDGVSLDRTTTISGLANGTEYECQVATVGAASTGVWTPASVTVTPVGRPAPPGKPTVDAQNGALQIEVAPPMSGLNKLTYECSPDNGATWPATVDGAPDGTPARVTGLANGVDYRCRAFAENTIGVSDASPLSDAVTPCNAFLECNRALLPVLAGLLARARRRHPRRAHPAATAVGRPATSWPSSTSSTRRTSAMGRAWGSPSCSPSTADRSTGSSPSAAARPRSRSGASAAAGSRSATEVGRRVVADGDAVDRPGLPRRPPLADPPRVRHERGVAGGQPPLIRLTAGVP